MKYFRRGKSKMKFLPAVAGASPTRAEITAGTDLSAQVSAIANWSFTGSRISTPNLANNFTPQITGEDTVGDASTTFYDDDTVETIRTALAKGTTGFVVFMPYGDVPTKRCEVWHVQTQHVSDSWTTDNKAAEFEVGYAVIDVPNQDATIPA